MSIKKIAEFDIGQVEYKGLLIYAVLPQLGFLLNKAKENKKNHIAEQLNRIIQSCFKKVRRGFKDFSEVRKVY